MTTYFCEDIDFVFTGRRANSAWLKLVVESENKKMGDVAIVFCSDEYLLDINRRYLKHDFYTDIITFGYFAPDEERISNDIIRADGNQSKVCGDLIISIDSVRANAQEYHTDFDEELRRVIVHGILHLLGYDDGTEQDREVMRQKEDYYLSLRGQM